MKILFLSVHISPGVRAVPLGAASVAAALLRGAGCEGGLEAEPELIDAFPGDDIGKLLDEILRREPGGVGFSVCLWNRSFALEVAERLHEMRPGLILFAGGPEITADPDSFAAVPFDFLVAGEGETATVKALQEFLSRASGSAPATTEAASVTGPLIYREAPMDPAALPSPWLTGLLKPDEMEGAVWELSRGCPFRCDFCFESRGEGKVRLFPMERIRQELQLFASSGVKELFVLDPTFNYNKGRAKELLQLFARQGPDIRYYLEVRSEYLDEELAELFSGISCSLQIGLQSARPEVLDKVNRRLHREDFYRKVLFLHEAGVDYGFDLIYGLPGDSFQGFLESIDFAFSMVPNHIDIFPLSVLPGTRLADTAAGFGLHYQRHNPYTVLSSSGFTEEDMERSGRLARSIDLFYNQGGAVTWFDILLELLGRSPSDFFLHLTDWMGGLNRQTQVDGEDSHAAVREFQVAFVASLFTAGAAQDGVEPGGAPVLSPEGMVLIDMIRLFGGPGESVPFFFHPGELLEQLDGGVRDPKELAFILLPFHGNARIEDVEGEIRLSL